MVRKQLFLDETMHARLRALARKQGRTVSELVRDALARAYGTSTADEELRTLRGIVGPWRDRKDIAAAATAGLRLWTLDRRHYPMKDVRHYAPGAAGRT
jgi:hypothetical protein